MQNKLLHSDYPILKKMITEDKKHINRLNNHHFNTQYFSISPEISNSS